MVNTIIITGITGDKTGENCKEKVVDLPKKSLCNMMYYFIYLSTYKFIMSSFGQLVAQGQYCSDTASAMNMSCSVLELHTPLLTLFL